MTHRSTYTYSQLSAESARRFVASNYDSVDPLHCKFYVLGLHDNYLIEGRDGLYVLRIYRNDWRNPEAIRFELDLLAYLHDRNAPVAWPILTTDGELAFRVESPEGERLAALFHYADGHAPEDEITTEQCDLLGRAVTRVHALSDTFSTKHQRPELDIYHLVDESIQTIWPFLDSDGTVYIDSLHKVLHRNWPGLPKEAGTFGVCIGDVNPKNFHVSRERNVTLFDFDQCGFGYRAFEIGKFASSLATHRQKRELVNAFLHGYQEGRCLSRVEYEAISYFELVAVLWVMSIHAKNADRIGYKYLEKPYWDRKLRVLRELEAQQGAASDAGDAAHSSAGEH